MLCHWEGKGNWHHRWKQLSASGSWCSDHRSQISGPLTCMRSCLQDSCNCSLWQQHEDKIDQLQVLLHVSSGRKQSSSLQCCRPGPYQAEQMGSHLNCARDRPLEPKCVCTCQEEQAGSCGCSAPGGMEQWVHLQSCSAFWTWDPGRGVYHKGDDTGHMELCVSTYIFIKLFNTFFHTK